MTHSRREQDLEAELSAFAERIQQVRQSPEVKSVVNLDERPAGHDHGHGHGHGDEAHHGH